MGFHFEQIKEESSIFFIKKKNKNKNKTCINFQIVYSKLIHMRLCPDMKGLQTLLFFFRLRNFFF
jgi:hypothetical protein